MIQELLDRLVSALFQLREAVEGIERPRFAVLQYDPHPLHPVVALPDDQVAHDVESAPGVWDSRCYSLRGMVRP